MRGRVDLFGNVLKVTAQAVADDLSSAAELEAAVAMPTTTALSPLRMRLIPTISNRCAVSRAFQFNTMSLLKIMNNEDDGLLLFELPHQLFQSFR